MQNKRKYSDFLSNQSTAPPPADPAMAQLAEDLVIEILLCLPVKSLLRFRCLSTYLSSLIDSPHFINLHRARSSQRFDRRKIIFLGCDSTDFSGAEVCDMNFDLGGEQEEEEEKEILRLENPVELPFKEVYGYCNGLLLVAQKPFNNQSVFGLWNPSTRQYQDFPRCDFGVPDDHLLRQSYSIIATGLGYDDSPGESRAYKAVLKLLFDRELIQVWIYELKSGIWRRTEDFAFEECLVYEEHPGISGIGHFTDGSLHWLYTIDSKTEIVAFDVRNETFSICSQPVCSIASMELHVLEGCLCISYLFNASEPSQTALYMRKKVGDDQFIWTQLYSVTEPLLMMTYWFDSVKVLGYTKRGHKILLDIENEFMLSYDLNEDIFREVEIYREDPACFDSMLSCLCIESLVTVVGGP